MKGIEKLIGLKVNDLEKFISGIENLNAVFPISKFIDASNFKGEDKALLSLISNINYNNTQFDYQTPAALAKTLIRVYNLVEEDIDLESFKQKLQLIVSSRILSILAKGEELSEFGGNGFISAKIVTSIIPIFNDLSDSPPSENSVVSNQLNIEFRDEKDEIKNIYIRLNSDDLKEIENCISRSIEKNELLSKSTLRYNTNNEIAYE